MAFTGTLDALKRLSNGETYDLLIMARQQIEELSQNGKVVAGSRTDIAKSGVGVAVGGFGDPSFPPPEDSVYDCRRHGWVRLPAGVTAYDKDPP